MDRGVLLFSAPFQEGGTGSHALLYEALRQYTGGPVTAPLAYGPYGKPYLPALPDLHFSITHSGAYWMCAVSDAPVGLDLQMLQDCDRPRLSRRFFHPDEDAYLRRRDYADFFPLWAAKESYLKYTGQGITDELSAFSTVSAQGDFPALPGLCLRLLPWRRDYALCLCTAAPCLCTAAPCPVRFQQLAL